MTSETDLLAGARRLEALALAEIYDRFSPLLYRYAVRLLGDAAAAEDCVAETFGRFLQTLQDGGGPHAYLQAYLFRTAHNLVVDQYRRTPGLERLRDDLPDGVDLESQAWRDIRRDQVRAALHELTPDQQQVIALKFLEGWENEEIAWVLKKPVGAVKSLQHRALARLQKTLTEGDA